MSEITSSNWDETAANNNAGSPNGWPENMNPSGVNDSARENMAALKRDWNRNHATRSSNGATSLTFTVSYSVNPTAYTRGDKYAFRAHGPCDNAPRFGVSGLTTKLMMKPTKGGMVTLSQSDIVAGQIVEVVYDTSLDAMIMTSTIPVVTGAAAPGTVTMIVAGAGISGGSISSSGTIALDFNELTLTTSISLSDIIPFFDGTNHRAITVNNIISQAIATQAQEEAGTVTTRLTTPGRQHFHPGVAKAWAMFDGTQGTATCTFAAAYNVTSITKVGTGVYNINFTNPFSSVNYVGVAMSDNASCLKNNALSLSTTFFPLRTQNAAGTATDSPYIFFIAFGDL